MYFIPLRWRYWIWTFLPFTLMDDSHPFSIARGLYITHFNIRSIHPHFDVYRPLLEHNNPSINCLTETWLNDATPTTFFDIPNYNIIRQDRNPNLDMRGGGLMTFIHESIPFDTLELTNLNISNLDIEMQWFTCKPNQMKKMAIGLIYRTQAGDTTQFHDHLTQAVD